MNATTYRWLIASHIEQVKAYLQRLETELEKIDSAEADDDSKHPTDTQATIAALRAEGFVVNVDADRLEITDEEGDCLRVDVHPAPHIIRAVIRSSGGVEVHLEAEDVRALIAILAQSVAEPATGADEAKQEREARRRRFNVNAEAVEQAKEEMAAAQRLYLRGLSYPDPKES